MRKGRDELVFIGRQTSTGAYHLYRFDTSLSALASMIQLDPSRGIDFQEDGHSPSLAQDEVGYIYFRAKNGSSSNTEQVFQYLEVSSIVSSVPITTPGYTAIGGPITKFRGGVGFVAYSSTLGAGSTYTLSIGTTTTPVLYSMNRSLTRLHNSVQRHTTLTMTPWSGSYGLRYLTPCPLSLVLLVMMMDSL